MNPANNRRTSPSPSPPPVPSPPKGERARTRGPILLALQAALLAVTLLPTLAFAEPPPMKDEARLHYERGLALYAAKDYDAAIAELEAGYALDPRREFLFAEAQAKRLAGDCPGAVGLYQRFLETEPPPAQVNATQIGLARCAQQMAARPAAPAIEAPPPVQPPAPSPPTPGPGAASGPTRDRTPAPAPERPPAWYRDPVGGALLGAGVVGLGLGTGFLISASSARDGARDYPDYERRWQTADSRWNVGVTSLIAGGVLTGAAVVRYVLVRRRARSGPEWTATAGPRGGLLLLGGRF